MLIQLKNALLASAAVAAVAACSATEPSPLAEVSSSAVQALTARPASGARIMPLHLMSAAPRVTASNAHLAYYGGPVIPNVKVALVAWNKDVKYQSKLASFYAAVTKTEYFDWLDEYDTPQQHIGRGSFAGAFVDPAAPTSTTLTNDQIQSELARLLDEKLVPENDGVNMLYMVHFPPGVSISLDANTSSCVQFCAYHNTFTHAGKNVYYSVTPDLGGACALGCGAGSAVQNLTAVSSHEMIEAVTDCAVGLATGNEPGAPMAWYDKTNGEIGDICVGQQGAVGDQTVQLEWSNHEGKCIATRSACSAGCGAKACGQDACGNPCGFCKSGQKCDDASGTCAACTPSCTGKTCGSDGCGGTCGTCSGTQSCHPDGTCGACIPSCNGQQCNQPDGCGGTCGCPTGKSCLPILNVCL